MLNYESPITQIVGEIQTGYENGVLKAVQSVGFHVNKEELTKALSYDRGQYQKGYIDGLNADKWIPCSERLPGKSDDYIITQKRYSVDDSFREKPISIEVAYAYFNAIDNKWNRAKFFDVIAWQPLPQPFKEGE